MKSNNQRFSVKCGKTTDDFEYLKMLCKKEAEKLSTTIAFSQSTISVPFWTEDIPELICVGNFYRNTEGVIEFDLDFSQTTL